MPIHVAFAGLAVGLLAGLGQATEPVTLPLRWLDKQAYVANVTIDGQPTLLQVGTFGYETWVACGRFGDRTCDTNRSAGSLGVENGVFDFSFLKSKKLAIGSVEYANAASMLRAEYNASTASKLPLVGNDTQGVLGLGPYNGLSCSDTNGDCGNVSLYLSRNSDGTGSFVQFGGDAGFAASLFASSVTTRYSLEVRTTDVLGWQNKRWFISLVGVRFGDNKPLYPRIYSPLETPGDDAKALVSLNHATLQMPPALHTRFMAMYLSGCDGYKSLSIGWYYECDISLMNSLPRLGLYVADKVLFLDPTDYTYVSSTDSKKLVVLTASSEMDGSWIIGAPFLRKFPMTFSIENNTIDVFCTVGSSCRIQSGVLDRQFVDSPEWSLGGSGSSSSGGGFGASTTSRPATSLPPSYGYAPVGNSTMWIMWIVKSLGFLMVFILVTRAVRRCRGRRQLVNHELELEQAGRNGDTGTVASERDLEEAKEELRRMQAEEEATAVAMAVSLNDMNYAVLQSPGGQRMPHTPTAGSRT